MGTTIVIVLSIAGQFLMAITFINELIKPETNFYGRIKCVLAATTFFVFALFLSWSFFITSFKAESPLLLKQPIYPSSVARK